jgi:hypothetical protein
MAVVLPINWRFIEIESLLRVLAANHALPGQMDSLHIFELVKNAITAQKDEVVLGLADLKRTNIRVCNHDLGIAQ